MDNLEFDPRPLYERDQVIIDDELHMLHREMSRLHQRTSWWKFLTRAEYQGGLIAHYD